MIILNLPYVPTPWQPARAGKGFHYDKKSKQKQIIKLLIKSQYRGPLIDTPVKVIFHFHFVPPASTSQKERKLMIKNEVKHTRYPDGTNCAKLVEDCLQNIVISNDKNVCEMVWKKFWSEREGIFIIIEDI